MENNTPHTDIGLEYALNTMPVDDDDHYAALRAYFQNATPNTPNDRSLEAFARYDAAVKAVYALYRNRAMAETLYKSVKNPSPDTLAKLAKASKYRKSYSNFNSFLRSSERYPVPPAIRKALTITHDPASENTRLEEFCTFATANTAYHLTDTNAWHFKPTGQDTFSAFVDMQAEHVFNADEWDYTHLPRSMRLARELTEALECFFTDFEVRYPHYLTIGDDGHPIDLADEIPAYGCSLVATGWEDAEHLFTSPEGFEAFKKHVEHLRPVADLLQNTILDELYAVFEPCFVTTITTADPDHPDKNTVRSVETSADELKHAEDESEHFAKVRDALSEIEIRGSTTTTITHNHIEIPNGPDIASLEEYIEYLDDAPEK